MDEFEILADSIPSQRTSAFAWTKTKLFVEWKNKHRNSEGTEKWVCRKTKQINHVQICYKRGSLPEPHVLPFNWSSLIMSQTASNTLLLRRQLQELMKHPVEGFSAGKIYLTFLSWLRRDVVSGLVNEDNLYEWEILIIGWVHQSICYSSRLWSCCCMQTTWYRLVRFGDLVLQSTSFTPFLYPVKEGSSKLFFHSRSNFLCYHPSCDLKRQCGIRTVSILIVIVKVYI